MAALKAAGAIRSNEPVAEVVKWTNRAGEEFEFEVHFAQLDFGTAMDMQSDENQDRKAAFIGRVVLVEDEGGALVPLGAENARRLDPRLGFALVSAFNRLNSVEPKNSLPPTSSSANSSEEESAATPSQKPEGA
ncbi:hypothetical protein BI380_10075 [Delftia tsuruhatensis]|uniref:Uncharacterized protein n=1 Tax=Delftia tsuruhatensis TaxID=180282 RepID=A0ABM6E2T7_9BURK|nr:hypothetical protein BI380_10075 [Delftia tsuruhatensis]